MKSGGVRPTVDRRVRADRVVRMVDGEIDAPNDWRRNCSTTRGGGRAVAVVEANVAIAARRER